MGYFIIALTVTIWAVRRWFNERELEMVPCPNNCGNKARRKDIRNYRECAPCFVGEDYWEWNGDPVEICSNCGSTASMWLNDTERGVRIQACENCSEEWVAWTPEPCMYCGEMHHPAKCPVNPWGKYVPSPFPTDDVPF